MSLGTILLIIVILALIGVLPVWPHASSWVRSQWHRWCSAVDRDRSVLDGALVIPRRDGGVLFHSKEEA
jgi:hypothetical protein